MRFVVHYDVVNGWGATREEDYGPRHDHVFVRRFEEMGSHSEAAFTAARYFAVFVYRGKLPSEVALPSDWANV